MAFLIILTLIITLISGLVHLIIRRIEYYKLRSRIGLKGPETHWFFGNLMQMVERTRSKGYNNSNEWHQQLHKEYGETFAVYLGKQLNIVVSNEEDIKEIFVRNFSNFSDRVVPPVLDRTRLATSLLQATYSAGWKTTRNAISPIFSSGKLKSMHHVITEKIDIFLEILEEKSRSNQGKWDIYDDFQALTMDVIGKCAFAVDSDCQRNRNELFYVQARKFVRSVDLRGNWILKLSFVFPEFSWFWKALYRFSSTAIAEKPLIDGLSDVYERRRAGEAAGSVDLLALLMDRKDMSKREVIENCFAFLVAGYETTSTAMTFCADLLARNPRIQKRLYQEILEASEGLNYEKIHGMKYLDALYKETLRIYPPVIHFITRTCLADIVIRGQLIPKDAMVTVLSYTVQRNPTNWPNPSEFRPERFLDSEEDSEDPSRSLKWIPFGVGPRFCVGMRFAEMEFKTTIAKLVERFEIGIGEDEGELICDCNGVVMRPKDPVRLVLKKRIK